LQVLDHLDHQPIPSPASVPSDKLQRLEKDLQGELHRHPAASFSADPEEFSFDLKQFSLGAARRTGWKWSVDHDERATPGS
jgi:hypothetical protein